MSHEPHDPDTRTLGLASDPSRGREHADPAPDSASPQIAPNASEGMVPHRIIVKALYVEIPSKGEPVKIEHHRHEPLLIEIDAIGFVDSDQAVTALLAQDHSGMPAANQRCSVLVDTSESH